MNGVLNIAQSCLVKYLQPLCKAFAKSFHKFFVEDITYIYIATQIV